MGVDYECSFCGRILTDEEMANNNGICDKCILHNGFLNNRIPNFNNIDLALEIKRINRRKQHG